MEPYKDHLVKNYIRNYRNTSIRVTDWYTGLGTHIPFHILLFQLHFNKKIDKAVISDFTMHLIILK